VYAVASVASAGLLWLYLGRLLANDALVFPYTAGYTTHLAILGWTLHVLRGPATGAWKRGMIILFQCWMVMFVPYVLVARFSRIALVDAAVALPLCGAAFAGFCIFEPRHDGLYSVGAWRWFRQAVVVLLTTVPLAFVNGVQ
jgi:hypothetical protein